MRNTFAMRTATIHDLQTRLSTVLAWVEAGEEVVVKPDAVKAAKPPHSEAKVDWTQSAAFLRDRTGEPVLSAKDLEELYDEMGSRY